ncbi:polyprenyl synthetase family protein [Aneurinibacillus sp. Ricciae_BoGa-3]|uniref:polyprenyl synthetase family protein n=1 Tax=Aneurinibacillus sp. Ricciae_BoGa-3 TaxID=3022697 RepID=UPI00234048F4|nr:farnesyl diphosphate synthase [Aneurinibacillus sp. Ricciae_BoGa-3]WCK56848.1 polyprenyl synthetase family protein [Aneurinibacillus sp. Ricciae_BoGa-3]
MLAQYIADRSHAVNKSLQQYLALSDVPAGLLEAMSYSIEAGGKRLRPILVLAVLDAFGKPYEMGLAIACAVEMIHTYSLIHDDLPAMDNDDFRRGRPTNHKVYGEAMAILAGDALLTQAFETLCEAERAGVPAGDVLRISREMAVYAGPKGMVGGQVADMEGENRTLTLGELQYIHRHKTGDLLVFCVRAGAIAAGATPHQLAALTRYGEHIGLAFQVKDDILDVAGDEAKLGKPVGSDEKSHKSTYPSLLGMERSKEVLSHSVSEAKKALREAGLANDAVLAELAAYIMERDH